MLLSRCLKYSSRVSPVPKELGYGATLRSFATSQSQRNRIYNSIRNDEEFSNIMLLSTSSNTALITLWTASWCRTCKSVAPIIRDYLEQPPTRDLPFVNYAEVEMDAPDMGEVSSRYMIRSIPMLLAFSRGEPQMDTVVSDAKKMGDRHFLQEWIEREARRAGQGGAGGSLLGGLFGKS